MMLAAITVEEVAGKVARELSDGEELAVITKERRKRLDSAATYAEAGARNSPKRRMPRLNSWLLTCPPR